MQLQRLTDDVIKKFAGATIFQRGYGYYTGGQVYDLQYTPESDTIEASVAGNYDNYDVYVTTRHDLIEGRCNCPYDGYPCKHVVATLLTFIHNKQKFAQEEKKRKRSESSLAKKMKGLSKGELEDLLLSYSKKYPDVKRDLMVRLEANNQTTFEIIQKQIARAFPSIESRNYSLSNIAKQLRTILKSVENASKEMQIKVYWAVTDRILEELNAYGIDDETLEGVAIDTMEALAQTFVHLDGLQEEKAEIIRKLMDYYHRGNFGITDWVYDTVMGLCTEKPDYQVVIESLERRLERETGFPSFYQGLLASLYAQIGDADAQRTVLEKNLQYGMDYWRLAEYWFEQGNKKKALDVIHTGLEKGEGRKAELYEALQKHYRKHKQYDQIRELLERKIERSELDHGPRRINLDTTYECLWNHYTKENNYERCLELLDLRVSNNAVDLEFYKEAEKILTPSDWEAVEPKIIKHLQDRIAEHRQQRQKQGWGLPYKSDEIIALAEIYHYKEDMDNLFGTVKEHLDLLEKYEALLLPHYPVEYLEHYQSKIDRLIAARGRNNYREAALYAKVVKRIYADVLEKPDDWAQYLSNLRGKHKNLRAFQQEFAKL